MTLNELMKERDCAGVEKAKLKEVIKKYEMEWSRQAGRPLSKENRELHKEDFDRYKVGIRNSNGDLNMI